MTQLTRVHSPLLLYDGLCGFCDGAVQFILRRDPQGPMSFAPLQGPTAQAVLSRHPELQDVDSLILVEGVGAEETVTVRSEAVLRIAGYLGGIWSLAGALVIVPPRLRDEAYAFFARHRHRAFDRYQECRMPDPGERDRFLP